MVVKGTEERKHLDPSNPGTMSRTRAFHQGFVVIRGSEGRPTLRLFDCVIGECAKVTGGKKYDAPQISTRHTPTSSHDYSGTDDDIDTFQPLPHRISPMFPNLSRAVRMAGLPNTKQTRMTKGNDGDPNCRLCPITSSPRFKIRRNTGEGARLVCARVADTGWPR